MLTLIAAVAANGVIGKNNKLPWHIPEDLKHFKALTVGHTTLMGRKTFESIMARLGKPLPNRKNIVITRQKNYQAPEGAFVHADLDEALKKHTDENIFVIGGAEMYRQTINRADRLEITHINKKIEGDATFPVIDPAVWKKTNEEKRDGFTFTTYRRNR